jgi:hypothetical protein
MIQLGDRVKDKITGLGGIVIGVTDWLYGCRRITVQPEKAKHGKPAETFCVDEPQLVVTKRGAVEGFIASVDVQKDMTETVMAAHGRPHGPREDAKMRRSVRQR